MNRETGTGALAANLSDDGEDQDVKDALKYQQPGRGFEGAEQQRQPRSKPVQFEWRMLEEDRVY